MNISRKDFLKGAIGTTGLLLLKPAPITAAKDSQTHAGMAMLIDVTKCVSCWWCYAACKEQNNLPETGIPNVENPPALSKNVWTTLHPVKKEDKWVSRKNARQPAAFQTCSPGSPDYRRGLREA